MQRENPKAKQTAFIETAAQVRRDIPSGVNEALMIGSDGRLLEGLSSNIFVVMDGVVWTAEEGVLSGITREVVLECIRIERIPLQLVGIRIEELERAQEVFITSASRAVLPVTIIDEKPVGDGRPGAVTMALQKAYRERVESELEEL
jgi:branched-subunit amino acid aminotransferase/4-amino-4-deoxychorismate lyase